MKRTTHQNTELHVLIARQGIDSDAKSQLVQQYTNGRTDSSSEMTDYECDRLIRALRSTGHPDILDKKRKRVISHLKAAGYTLPDGRAAMPAIHAWVMAQKHKKPINSLTSPELSQLITAAEGVMNHYLSKVR